MVKLTQNAWFLAQVAKWAKCGIKEIHIGAVTYTINADLLNCGFITVCAQHNATNTGILYTIALDAYCARVTKYGLNEYGACYLIGTKTTRNNNILDLFNFAL